MRHALCAIRWATIILFPSHWFCQRADFSAGNVFVWLFFWLRYDRHRISYRQSFRCLFCEIVWLQLDLFLSLALYFSFSVKIDGVSNHEYRLTPPENVSNWSLGNALHGLLRSGSKTPSKVQWLRCRPPVNAHIPMYAVLSRSA
jgi:hypothetical protein